MRQNQKNSKNEKKTTQIESDEIFEATLNKKDKEIIKCGIKNTHTEYWVF